MWRRRRRSPWLLLWVLGVPGMAIAAEARAQLATRSCEALDAAVRAVPGEGAVLLPSYRVPTQGETAIAALRGVAFTYDNALASIALYACARPRSATRIAAALLQAGSNDPDYRDGRLRNGYAAGAVAAGPVRLAGYWDPARAAWNQDAYQAGTATGNQAWAALALLEAYRRTGDGRYLQGARRALAWIAASVADPRAPDGFAGGYFGYPPLPTPQRWKSTEHHVDIAAAAIGLQRLEPDAALAATAARARGFVAAQWDDGEGRFLIGRDAAGQPDRARSGLDAQLWPLIAFDDAPPRWRRALAFVDAQHRHGDGYGFGRAPDGVWTEGTAQYAAVAVQLEQPARAQALWPLLLAQDAGDGWLYATPQARLSTGLAIGPGSSGADFVYYHLPHLGATAWAAIAACGSNPFTGTQRRS